jgi:hypothetical protein
MDLTRKRLERAKERSSHKPTASARIMSEWHNDT